MPLMDFYAILTESASLSPGLPPDAAHKSRSEVYDKLQSMRVTWFARPPFGTVNTICSYITDAIACFKSEESYSEFRLWWAEQKLGPTVEAYAEGKELWRSKYNAQVLTAADRLGLKREEVDALLEKMDVKVVKDPPKPEPTPEPKPTREPGPVPEPHGGRKETTGDKPKSKLRLADLLQNAKRWLERTFKRIGGRRLAIAGAFALVCLLIVWIWPFDGVDQEAIEKQIEDAIRVWRIGHSPGWLEVQASVPVLIEHRNEVKNKKETDAALGRAARYCLGMGERAANPREALKWLEMAKGIDPFNGEINSLLEKVRARKQNLDRRLHAGNP